MMKTPIDDDPANANWLTQMRNMKTKSNGDLKTKILKIIEKKTKK